MKTRPIADAPTWLPGLVFLTLCGLSPAAEVDPERLPPAATVQVDYNRDIKPIFDSSCFRCHGPEKPKSGFRLDNQQTALKGGKVNTNDIVPFRSADSMLVQYVGGLDVDMKMPPVGKGNPLTPDQIGLLRAWIEQGAKWPPDEVSAGRPSSLSITPVVGGIAVSGNKQKFREDWSQTDGFVIGYESFELREPVGKDAEFVATGRALFNQQDYKVSMSLTKPDLGYVRAGYDTFRKYYNNVGGFYQDYPNTPFGLNRDLFVDNGKAWFEVGMTVPELPKISVGYEYLSRSGDESTLHWGYYDNANIILPPGAKAILPASRGIDESTQVIKMSASYEPGGFLLEDNFRGEFYKLKDNSSNIGVAYSVPGTGQSYVSPDAVTAESESYRHFNAVNAFRAEKQVRDWFFVSGGYLYTHLNGDSSFSQVVNDPSISHKSTDISPDISLQRVSNTINLNALLGPWKGVTFSAGVQAEWAQSEGMGDRSVEMVDFGSTTQLASPQKSNLDKSSVQEDFALRYTKIPFTVLYAEANFAQETYDLYQSAFTENTGNYLRDSDSTVNLQDYQVGFAISPWPRVSLDSSYQYRDKRNNYQNVIDTIGNGYPQYIQWLDIVTDQVEAKLTVRLVSWLRMTLKYQLVSTEYRNNVDSTPLTVTANYPGGQILSGDYDANVYSINLTLTPWRRLYLSTLFSYSDSSTVSGVNNRPSPDPSVVPYKGDLYSVLVSANYALNKSTDFNATYSYSRANYQQNNVTGGLPLGIVYDRNAVMIGIKRRFTRNLTGQLHYAFATYHEPSSNGANNYTGNAVFGSFNLSLP